MVHFTKSIDTVNMFSCKSQFQVLMVSLISFKPSSSEEEGPQKKETIANCLIMFVQLMTANKWKGIQNPRFIHNSYARLEYNEIAQWK